MAASPSLSHSSQGKAVRQGMIERREKVRVECSSGWCVAYLVCVVCVQMIARHRSELADPSTSAERRAGLEGMVQQEESFIQLDKLSLEYTQAELASTAAALMPQGNSHDDITLMNIIKNTATSKAIISWSRPLSLCSADHSSLW